MKTNKKSSIIISVLGLWFALTGLASSATKIEVEIEDFAYLPAQITIQVGDTVEWKNRDNVAHTTTSGEPGVPDGMWDSGLLATDQEFTYVFNDEGSFPYYCTPHNWMTGLVTVESSDTGTVPGVEEPPVTISDSQLIIQSSVIQLTLPAPGSVTLTIHDVLGREVVRLADGALSAGSHSFTRPVLASGIYFARLVSADGLVITKRILQIT